MSELNIKKDYYTKEEIAKYLRMTPNSLTAAYRRKDYSLPKRTIINKKKYHIKIKDFNDWEKLKNLTPP